MHAYIFAYSQASYWGQYRNHCICIAEFSVRRGSKVSCHHRCRSKSTHNCCYFSSYLYPNGCLETLPSMGFSLVVKPCGSLQKGQALTFIGWLRCFDADVDMGFEGYLLRRVSLSLCVPIFLSLVRILFAWLRLFVVCFLRDSTGPYSVAICLRCCFGLRSRKLADYLMLIKTLGLPGIFERLHSFLLL